MTAGFVARSAVHYPLSGLNHRLPTLKRFRWLLIAIGVCASCFSSTTLMNRSVCITRQSLIPMTSASGGPRLLIWLERSQLSSKVG